MKRPVLTMPFSLLYCFACFACFACLPLTTACAKGGRQGADSNQAALHKAPSSV